MSGAKIEGLSGPAGAAARAARSVSPHGHRKAAGVRARPPARVLRSAGGAQDRPRRGRRGLSLVVAHSGDREESDVSDAGIPGGDELNQGDERCLSSLRNRCRGGPSCGGWARRWRCRSWRRCFPRSRCARGPLRSRCIGSRRSTCRTAWPWSTGRRKGRAAPSSSRRFSSRWRRSGIRCSCCPASRRTGTTSTRARPDRF